MSKLKENLKEWKELFHSLVIYNFSNLSEFSRGVFRFYIYFQNIFNAELTSEMNLFRSVH